MNKKLIASVAVGVVVAGSAWYIYKVRSYLMMKVNDDGIKENVSALPNADTWSRDFVRDSKVESHNSDGMSDTSSVS